MPIYTRPLTKKWHRGLQEWQYTTIQECTKNENAGVHQTTNNSGVRQNANTHSPQNGHNDLRNDPTIKTKNIIDVTGGGNEAEDEDENEEEN